VEVLGGEVLDLHLRRRRPCRRPCLGLLEGEEEVGRSRRLVLLLLLLVGVEGEEEVGRSRRLVLLLLLVGVGEEGEEERSCQSGARCSSRRRHREG